MLSPSTLQTSLAAYLLALSDVSVNGKNLPLQNVSIITADADADAGDLLLEDRVMKSLAGELPRNGKFGLAVIVDRPTLKNAQPNGGIVVEDSEIVLELIEDTATNASSTTGTGVTLDELRSALANLLHAWCHDGTHGLIYRESTPIPDKALPDHKRGWLMSFESKAHGHKPFTRVARPVLVLDGGSLTIVNGTSHASVYYSLDGSTPATLYTGVLDVGALPSGTLVQAIAIKDGMPPSHTAALTL